MESPTGLAVESFTHRSATMTWTDAEGSAFCRVYYGLTSQFGEATLYGTVLAGIGRSTIYGLHEETQYNFWVVAEGDDGSMSDPATASCVTSSAPSGDFDVSAVQDAIYEWAVNNFGDYAVIWEKQNGTRPGKPFVSLSMGGSPAYGGDDHVRDGERVCGNRIFTINVNVYSDDDPTQKAMDLRSSLQRPDVVDFFDEAEIGIGEIGPVTDVSELLDNSNWEQRAHFDFGALVASDKPFDAGQISEVELENQIGR